MSSSPPTEPQQEDPTHTYSPVLIRSAALTGILFLMAMYTLYFAAALLIPITLALLLSVVLSPVVRFLVRLRVPQILCALLTMLTFAGLLTAIVYAIAQPAIEWMDRAPTELRQLEYKLAWVEEPINEFQRAREQMDRIAGLGDDIEDSASPGGSSFSLVGAALETAPNVVFGIAVTFILLFFLLASGDSLLNKAVQVSPTLSDKRRVVETGRRIQQHVSKFLGTIALINLCVGALVAGAMYLLSMPNPLLWGVMVGVLNFVPYLGVLVSIVVVTLVGLFTFETPLHALWPPLAIFVINVIEGQFITPILAGRRLALSPVAVFLSLVVMGWMWGFLGVLIAVPLLAIVKLVSEELGPLQWLATFLSDR